MIRKGPFLALLIFLAVTASGCIDAGHHFYVRYDKDKDSFSCLHVFSDIASDNARELKYLHALVAKKGSIIILPLPAILGPPLAVIRLDEQMFDSVNLANPPADFKEKLAFPHPVKFPVDLAPIKVRPGVFFLNERKYACYWHEAEMPGAIADQLLVILNKEMCKKLESEIDRMIMDYGDFTVRRVTWEDQRKTLAMEIRNEIRKTPKEVPPPRDDPRENGPFELASLKAVRKAAAANELALKRKGSRVSFDLPITNEDARQMILTLDHARKVATEEFDKKQADDPNLGADDKKMITAWKRTIAEAAVYKAEPGQGVHMELELSKVFALLNLGMEIDSRQPLSQRFARQGAAAEAKYHGRCAALLKSLKDRGVEVAPKVDGQKLLAPYLK
jgi:hypothetical protein